MKLTSEALRVAFGNYPMVVALNMFGSLLFFLLDIRRTRRSRPRAVFFAVSGVFAGRGAAVHSRTAL